MISFYRCYGLEAVSLRYFNVFGPRQDPTSPYSGVLAKFITQMLKGEPATILGDGKQSRDFTFVDNVVEANLLACHADTNGVAGRVINVATGQRTDLYQTFQILKKLIGYPGDVKYRPERAADIKHSLADISRAEHYLGYEPKVDFEEGLIRTIQWYRNLPNRNSPRFMPQSSCSALATTVTSITPNSGTTNGAASVTIMSTNLLN